MKHGSLFSGIGGFDLAAEWAGWTNVFHCEYNPFGQRVLKHYWPDSISYGDIKHTDFTIHRGQIDVISGGFPCQPFSSAGKRKGTEDDRHLWPEMLRAIREISPRYVVGENVRGFTNWNGGMVFDQVQAELEAEGYEVLPFLLPACAVNAPHRRDRIWIVAHRKDVRSWDTTETGRERQEYKPHNGEAVRGTFNEHGQGGPTPDTEGQRRPSFDRPKSEIISAPQESGIYGRSSHGFSKSTTWSNFPTQPPVCGRNDGLSPELDGITVSRHRKESIMAYGNAIVPQVAFELFKVINAMSKNTHQDLEK